MKSATAARKTRAGIKRYIRFSSDDFLALAIWTGNISIRFILALILSVLECRGQELCAKTCFISWHFNDVTARVFECRGQELNLHAIAGTWP